MHSTKTRLAASMVVLGALVAVSTSAVAAPTDAAVTAGTLAFTAAPAVATSFTAVALNGTAQTTTAGIGAFTVNDFTGTGAGWRVTAQGTQFKQYDSAANSGTGGYVTSGRTLAASSLTLSAPTVTANGTTSGLPAVAGGTLDSTNAVAIATAIAGNGMGKYDFTPTTMTLSVPASAYAATYRSDVTVSVVSGP